MQKVPVIFIHFNLFSFSIKDYNITWVDDTHALAVFASQAAGWYFPNDFYSTTFSPYFSARNYVLLISLATLKIKYPAFYWWNSFNIIEIRHFLSKLAIFMRVTIGNSVRKRWRKHVHQLSIHRAHEVSIDTAGKNFFLVVWRCYN